MIPFKEGDRVVSLQGMAMRERRDDLRGVNGTVMSIDDDTLWVVFDNDEELWVLQKEVGFAKSNFVARVKLI